MRAMVEKPAPTAAPDADGPISPIDALHYINMLSGELAGMADRHKFARLAAALEMARGLAGEALAKLAQDDGNAAPEDAA